MNPLIHDLFQTSRYLSYKANQTLKQHGLYSSQWSVLYCVERHKEMTLTQIWKYLNVEAPTITRTVNRLADLGWLEISSGRDRREKMVKLTTEALHNFPVIKSSMSDFENSVVSNLSQEEQNTLMELLRKIK